MPSERTCRKCGHTGPAATDFYQRQGNRCRSCTKQYDADRARRLREEGGERYRQHLERQRLRRACRRYGITMEEAAELYAQRKCSICGGVNRSGRALNIDHCHRTGQIRGMTCARCNRGLGCYDDDPALLRKAARYLEDSRTRGRLTTYFPGEEWPLLG